MDASTLARSDGRAVGVVLGGLAGVAGAVLLFVAVFASQPSHVAELTIENPTDTRLQVGAKSDPDASVLRLTTIGPSETRTVTSVIDQGERWIFVVGWRDVREEFTLSRAELEDNDWTVRLPQEAADAVVAEYPLLGPQEGAPAD